MRARGLLLIASLAFVPAAGNAQNAAPIPDFSGIWWHPSLPGVEPLPSGPTSLVNKSRRNGVSNYSS